MDVTPPARPPGRPRVKEGPKKPPKKFRNVHVSFKKKQAVIDSFDEMGMAATLLKHFPHLRGPPLDTTRKKVYAWLKHRAHIKVKATNPRTSKHLCSRELGMATTLPKESEEQIAVWVHSMRKDGTAIAVGLDESAFVASWSWLEGFKRRFRLSLRARTRQGQDTQGDGDAALATFSARVAQVVRDNDIDVIYNADQTGVHYEYLPTKTLSARGDNTVWIKCGGKSKDRATAMTPASKIKAVVQEILTLRQGFGKQLWKDVEHLQNRFQCRIYGNPTAWWNSLIGVDFLRYHFAERPDRATKKLNVVLEKIPPRFTWMCQPADVAWIRPMKSQLRKMWIDSIRRQVKNSKSQNSTFKLQAPKHPTLVQWITDAWFGLSEAIITNGFAKCKIVHQDEAVDETVETTVPADILSELVANSAVDDTIDPTDDIENMAQGERLTLHERGSIIAFRKAKWPIRKIAAELFLSKGADGLSNWKRVTFVVCSEKHQKEGVARPRSNTTFTARTLRRVLQRSKPFIYKKRKTTPRLTNVHKQARVDWAKEHVDFGPKWDNVIFSDEKQFNLDGPDGLQYYWHDLRKEDQTFLSRQNGGGSVMSWGGFSSKGRTSLAILFGCQDSFAYCDTVANFMVTFAHAAHVEDFLFQQDNASIHASKETTAFLADIGVDVLSWPSLSPDLKPIANLWGYLARKVYANGR
ncbi:hypothetical protein H257_06966 [Aphanomyces astaci]|uniref:Uncharacterized protein n=1 Tax=Aphanomyces astaci TaxID=112090 RepID=W4GL14_APHAT|nr:hypothetical protein H257_06966 [Aphanomyces astaci]ETV79729.1 hypothetical protein H257_06966 [Aphanomyces astaci]|eukprot:XP_009830665.1 hypothetical protein H257_06966 [Aphanomyces astaci]